MGIITAADNIKDIVSNFSHKNSKNIFTHVPHNNRFGTVYC